MDQQNQSDRSSTFSPQTITRKVRTSRSERNKMNNSNKRSLFTKKWIFLVLFTSILLIAGGCTAVFMQGKTFDIGRMGDIQNNSAIYDQKGNKIAELGNFRREVVSLEDINKVNPLLPKAFVKVEDVRFYEHNGVDYYGLGRAFIKNLVSGEKAQGASTITMQVAGNVILEDRRKTYTRKIKEIATAWNLEQRYTKDQILEAYLNYIYFGNNVRGIQMASKIYFGKDVTKDHLSIAEIAFLAGLPKAPEGYNPYASDKSKQRAMERRAVVLNEMAETNEMPALITEAQKQRALNKPLGTDEKRLSIYGKKDRYEPYKQYVLKELNDRYGIPATDVENKGYKIITGINPEAQKATDRVLKEASTYKFRDILDGGSATLDPKTGLLAAIGGGRHYEGHGFRINGQLPVQPGSSIKPLTVYAPAIEKSKGDINEYTVIPDRPITIDGYSPRNYNRQFEGDVSLSEVAKKSLNSATVWLLANKVGVNTAYDYGTKLGLPLVSSDKNIAPLALGGLTKGASPLQMAQAYTALANNGVMTEAHAIDKVIATEDGQQQEVKSNYEPKQERIFSPKTAYYMTRILEQVVESGTGKSAQLGTGQPVAGKTGTTQNNIAGWFTGYTPQYVTTTMVYNTSSSPLTNQVKDLTGGAYGTHIFREIMRAALSGSSIQSFERPSGVEAPIAPFTLETPTLQGYYDSNQSVIQLHWANQGPRVKYQLLRSEDGNNFTSIYEGQANGFTDTQIQIPQPNFIQGLFGNGGKKTYTYQIIAIDTQTNEQKTSSSISIEVKSKSDHKPSQKPEQQQPTSPQPPNGNQPPAQNQQPGQNQPPTNQQPPNSNSNTNTKGNNSNLDRFLNQ